VTDVDVPSEAEALKEQVRQDHPDFSDEQVEGEVQRRLSPTRRPDTRGQMPFVEPERNEDNPKPQGTF
jgi:hypothetical protein